MSWSVSAFGKPLAVAAKVQADLNTYKCVDPEEGVKQAVASALGVALAAQNPAGVVRVEASGHQSGSGGTAVNTLSIKVEPITGFVE